MLNGVVDPIIFQNAIVYVGAYGTGLMDSYAPAIASILVSVFCFIAQRLKVVPAGILMAVLAVGSVVVTKASSDNGYILPVLVFPGMLVISYAVTVIIGYVEEVRRKRQIIGVFKQYMAPQIVEEISKKKILRWN